MTDNIFDRCRSIPAYEVARREGLDLRQRGQRYWTCCPFHGEKTPSLCFYPDGRYYCFGCNAHGDAVDLLAKLRDISPLDAARALMGDWNPASTPTPAQQEREQRKRLQAEHKREHDRLCKILHAAKAVMIERETVIPDWDALDNDPEFIKALATHTAAATMLDNMDDGEGAGW